MSSQNHPVFDFTFAWKSEPFASRNGTIKKFSSKYVDDKKGSYRNLSELEATSKCLKINRLVSIGFECS